MILLVFSGGCASTAPTQFYLLHSLPHAGEGTPAPLQGQSIAVGIGPIYLPDYLDRPQIVIRKSPNELDLAEFDKWAEPLKENFLDVMAENLSILLSTERIFIHPWETYDPVQFQVTVDVVRFDSSNFEHALLNARWTIQGERGEKVLVMRKSSFSEPIASQTYKALVAAESKVLADFCREIADALRTVVLESPEENRNAEE
jgi:uncharacterized lipoprotein YmbA